jgi:hypothetical protein
MTGADFHDDVARVEERIEELGEAIERCRKISFAARLAIAAGAIWLALTLLGLVWFEPYLAIASMAGVLGGIVLLGSNATTWTQTDAALAASESMRSQMIGDMEMKVVDGGVRRLH